MLGFLRRNAIALTALFVALGGTSYAVNTIRSSDIVDGEVKTADLGANAVTSAKIANGGVTWDDIGASQVSSSRVQDRSLLGLDLATDTLTGQQISEGTLGKVPSASGADSLGGTYAHEFRPGTAQATQRTDQCAVVGSWRECAPVTLTVPPGESYKVEVHASITAWGASNSGGFFCAAYEGPSCLTGVPTGFTLETNKYAQVSHSGTAYFGAGTHRFNAAVRLDGAIGAATNGMSTVTIRWHNYWAEQATEPSASAAKAKAASRTRAAANLRTAK